MEAKLPEFPEWLQNLLTAIGLIFVPIGGWLKFRERLKDRQLKAEVELKSRTSKTEVDFVEEITDSWKDIVSDLRAQVQQLRVEVDVCNKERAEHMAMISSQQIQINQLVARLGAVEKKNGV